MSVKRVSRAFVLLEAVTAGAFAKAGADSWSKVCGGFYATRFFTQLVVEEPPRQAVELVELRASEAVEPIRLRLPGGRELVLPASMSEQRVAAMVEGRGEETVKQPESQPATSVRPNLWTE